MSLKSKLSPEARLALRIANAIKPELGNEPKGILTQLGSNLLLPLVIGLVIGLGTNYFQAQENLRVWQAEHKAESESKLATTRADILAAFQQTVSEYVSFDVETSIEYNALVFQKAIKMIMPDININMDAAFKGIPPFPTADQSKENTRIWSKLESLTQSINIYFGDKIGAEASSLLASLNAEPTHMLDIHVAAEQLQKLKEAGNINLDSLSLMMSPYLSPARHSPQLDDKLRKLGMDMQCMTARNSEFDQSLVSASCP